MKLALNLEELTVDSFATAAAGVPTGLDSSGWSCDSVCPTVDSHRCPP